MLSHSPTSNSTGRANSKMPKKQAITFLVSAADDRNPSSTLTSAPMSYQQSTKINSLCEILKQTQKPKHGVGYLDDQFWRHVVASSRPQILPVEKSDLVSIADLLGRRQQSKAKQVQMFPISTREKYVCLYMLDMTLAYFEALPISYADSRRYRIALLLASAVLQLFQTPWLADPSMLDKIYLVPPQAGSQSGSHSSGILPTTKDLYILGQSPTPPPATQNRFWIPNETLFTLSILLLELSYLSPLSSFKTSADIDVSGNDTLLTEHSIAARLVDNIVSREPSRYSEAVRRCLYCQFETSSRDLSDGSLQEEFWRGVVEPLRELDAIFA
jgi:hypothetical protein